MMEHFTDSMLSFLDQIEASGSGVRHDRSRFGSREPIDLDLRKAVYRRDGWTCQWCGLRQGDMRFEGVGWDAVPVAEVRIVLDHVWPWSDHGPDRSWNLRVLCWECNADRSNRLTDTAMARPLPIATCCTRCCETCVAHGHADAEHIPAWCADCSLAGTTEGPLGAML